MLGADIEFFLRDPANGKMLPSCGLIGGTKDQAVKIDDIFSILEDGAAVELNYAPVTNPGDWNRNILRSVAAIRNHCKGAYEVSTRNEALFPESMRQFPQAMEIGCAPDFDAYAKKPEKARKIPSIKKFGLMRFAGGHIHLSYLLKERFPPWVVARLMDLLVLMPTIVDCANSRDLAEMFLGHHRREFYGRPGLHRPKPYGVEYRVFSNTFALNAMYCNALARHLGTLHTQLNEEKYAEPLERTFTNTNWAEVVDAVERLDLRKMGDIYHGASRQLTGF